MKSLFQSTVITLLIAVSGCGGNEGASPSPRCITGTSALCACASGRTGAQTCRADGTFGACSCEAADSGPALDVALDAPPADREAPPPDTAFDAPPDVVVEDGGFDASLDEGVDAADDPPDDVVIVDVPIDLLADVPSEPRSDVPADVRVDAPADVPTDLRADVGTDAPMDVPADLPADVAGDIGADVTGLACFPGACNVAELGGSPNFRCARLTTGALYCWGSPYLGNGTTQPSLRPTPLSALTNVTQLDLGGYISCARQASTPGLVFCWGNQWTGTGTPGIVTTPTRVTDLTDAVAVAAGEWHACAIRATGQVACWGSGSRGGLGNGATFGNVATPTNIAGLTEVVALWAGAQRTCARRRSGQVLCWGRNDFGMLGDGTTVDRLVPTPTPALDGVLELAFGEDFTCGRFADARVRCWGYNGWGSLGNGRLDSYPNPMPTLVPGVSDVVQIAAGGGTACAREASGRLLCWGIGMNGEIGDGLRSARSSPAVVPGVPDAVLVDVAFAQSAGSLVGTSVCALRRTGRLLCWGEGDNAQLGNGARADTALPVEVIGLPVP
jgi:alpha-tubulin suppressor-like RCC1 family protein